MMTNWKKVKLDDIAVIHNSKRIPLNSREREVRKGKFPYYGASGIVDYVDDFLFDGEHVLISEDGENLKSRQTPIAFKANGKFWVNNHAHIVKGKRDYFNDWIVYYFSLLDLNPYISGAVQPKLNKENLLSIPIDLPEERELKSIIKIIRSLDDKIELNRQMNQTLEQMAQALFKKYFVEDTKTKVDVSLLDFAEIISGGTPKTSVREFWDGDVFWISAKDVTPNTGGFIVDTERKVTQLGIMKSNAKLLPAYSTVITARGTVGNYCLTPFPMAISQSNYALSSRKIKSNFVLFKVVANSIDEMKRKSYGTVFDTITTKTLADITISVPDDSVIESLENLLEPIYFKILNGKLENQKLSNLREFILPKLLSGEIEIKEAEAVLA